MNGSPRSRRVIHQHGTYLPHSILNAAGTATFCVPHAQCRQNEDCKSRVKTL